MFYRKASMKIVASISTEELSGLVEKYKIELDADLDTENYLFFKTIVMTGDVVNGNGDMMPTDELKKAYKTLEGRGMYIEHDTSFSNLVGKVVKAFWEEDDKQIWAICAIDKKLAGEDMLHQIRTGLINSVSMGCLCDEAECSICHNVAKRLDQLCAHMNPEDPGYTKAKIIDATAGTMAYEINRGIAFQELSLVSFPAFPEARIKEVVGHLDQWNLTNANIKLSNDNSLIIDSPELKAMVSIEGSKLVMMPFGQKPVDPVKTEEKKNETKNDPAVKTEKPAVKKIDTPKAEEKKLPSVKDLSKAQPAKKNVDAPVEKKTEKVEKLEEKPAKKAATVNTGDDVNYAALDGTEKRGKVKEVRTNTVVITKDDGTDEEIGSERLHGQVTASSGVDSMLDRISMYQPTSDDVKEKIMEYIEATAEKSDETLSSLLVERTASYIPKTDSLDEINQLISVVSSLDKQSIARIYSELVSLGKIENLYGDIKEVHKVVLKDDVAIGKFAGLMEFSFADDGSYSILSQINSSAADEAAALDAIKEESAVKYALAYLVIDEDGNRQWVSSSTHKFSPAFSIYKSASVQSVVFEKDKWTEDKAKGWLKSHGYKFGDVDKKENTLRFRQKEPGDKKYVTKDIGKGIKLIIDFPKGSKAPAKKSSTVSLGASTVVNLYRLASENVYAAVVIDKNLRKVCTFRDSDLSAVQKLAVQWCVDNGCKNINISRIIVGKEIGVKSKEDQADKGSVEKGIKVEMEHAGTFKKLIKKVKPDISEEEMDALISETVNDVVADHLKESPVYYEKLAEIEKSFTSNEKKDKEEKY